MLNPVLIPLPVALAAIAALAVALYAWRQWVEAGLLTIQSTPKAKPATGGRHRSGAVNTPYRPRSAAERAANREPVFPIEARPVRLERALYGPGLLPRRVPGDALAAELEAGQYEITRQLVTL